ncbi:MAG: histidine phosphatase family protein [Myxococcota bacterium]
MRERLERLVFVRHGETAGQSSIRYYGATDVPLSDEGREQVRRARERIAGERFEVVWASSLSRAAESARILAPERSIHLEADFREVDFGRWEGLTREEIAVRDPELFPIWQRDLARFDYPDGERRADFRARIARGLERLRTVDATTALVVAHKGVVRTLLELVSGETLPGPMPELGGIVRVVRGADGRWRSDPIDGGPAGAH